jgi:DNA-binding PadR family transcriptional regulator
MSLRDMSYRDPKGETMKVDPEVNDLLPLTEATFFILLSLAPGPKHGYAIMQAVREMSRGRVSFSTGTLYGALKRLLDQGWIARSGEGESDDDHRPRKEYALTPLGKKVFETETARMDDLVHLALSARPGEAWP